MLVRLAILEAPHIEPRRGVALRGILLLYLAYVRHHHEIAFGHHCHDLGLHLLRNRHGLHLSDFGEVLHHTLASGPGVRVVLDVALRQILVCQLPMPRLEQILDDVVGDLLVRIELWVTAVEEGVRTVRAKYGFLCRYAEAPGKQDGGEYQRTTTHVTPLRSKHVNSRPRVTKGWRTCT